jgi:Carboxypeptidase regulatory-like domain
MLHSLNRRRRVVTGEIVPLVLLMLAAPASAQTGLTGGAVQGTVRSETGQPLGDVTVSLVAESTGITRMVVTDAEGGYRLAALPLGTYRLRVERKGFRPLERDGLTPAVGQVLVVDVSLALARSETVSVHHEGTASGNEGASVAARVGERPIEALPAHGRDFVAFSLLTPGVTAERTPPTGPTTSSGLSFAGQRARANHVMVDGFDNDDAYTGGWRPPSARRRCRSSRCSPRPLPRSSATLRAGP